MTYIVSRYTFDMWWTYWYTRPLLPRKRSKRNEQSSKVGTLEDGDVGELGRRIDKSLTFEDLVVDNSDFILNVIVFAAFVDS